MKGARSAHGRNAIAVPELQEDAPDSLRIAQEDLLARGPSWERGYRAGLRRLSEGIRMRLETLGKRRRRPKRTS